MGFSEDTIKRAWQAAGGKCECSRIAHGHRAIHCGQELVWANRGREGHCGAWEVHHLTGIRAGGSDTLSNCEILCWECLTALR